jgi:hypothetical protein
MLSLPSCVPWITHTAFLYPPPSLSQALLLRASHIFPVSSFFFSYPLMNPTSPYARERNPWAQEPQQVTSTIDDDQIHSLGLEWDSGSMDSAAPSRFTQYLYFLGYWGLNPVRLACAFVPIWYTPDPCLSTLWEVSKYTQNFWEQTVVQAAACCLVLSGKECFLPVGSVLPAPWFSTFEEHCLPTQGKAQ